MFESPRPSLSVSLTPPRGTPVPETRTRRRGLSSLRSLAYGRLSSNTTSDHPGPSSRYYISRSISVPASPTSPEASSPPATNSRGCQTTEVIPQPQREPGNPSNTTTRPAGLLESRVPGAAQTPSRQRSVSAQPQSRTSEQDLTVLDMARHRNTPRASVPDRNTNATSQRLARVVSDDATDLARPNTHVASTRERPVLSSENSEMTETKSQLPTIRFFPHQEIRNGRQSLNFAPVARTLPNESSIIRVGRYSEREGIPTSNPTTPSDAPVGFKSKVVSRKHCEFSFVDGQWQIKDVCSSSGTFLNHIRLSQPNTESKLFPVKDGDIVQLGIDFRGGEEMIFRCVKIRIECNRSWQKRPNNFNKSRHAQLQSLGKTDSTGSPENNGECSICLGAVLPCQSLFVAPCAHVWHYKCIRPLLEGRQSTYPQFQCPNCRAITDLSAEVDTVEDLDEWMENAPDGAEETNMEAENLPPHTSSDADNGATAQNDTVANATIEDSINEHEAGTTILGEGDFGPPLQTSAPRPVTASGLLARRQTAKSASSDTNMMNGIDMPHQPTPTDFRDMASETVRVETPTPADIISGEGPLTPRNNAGPFVFDGSAGRASGRRLVVPSSVSPID